MATRGFTLIELLAAMALLAILGLLAAPGFGEYLRNCRRTTTINALAHAIHSARTLSAAQGHAVRLCPSDDSTRCTGGRTWDGVLLIDQESSADRTIGQRPSQIVHLAADGSRQTVRSNRDFIRFAPLATSATTTTLTVCDDRGARAARAIIVSRVGRPRISDRDASGRLLQCR